MILTKSGEPLPNTTFTLRFEGNKGHDYGDGREKKTARLHNVNEAFDTAHPWVETLDVTTDADGKVSVWVLSSDVISQPKLQAVQKVDPNQDPVILGELSCDFADNESLRNFEDKASNNPETEDTGWLFYFPKANMDVDKGGYLAEPDQEMPAKVYLKFMIDPTKGNKPGNWQYVNGHSLTLHIDSLSIRKDTDATDGGDGGATSSDDNGTPPPDDIVGGDPTDPGNDPIGIPNTGDPSWPVPDAIGDNSSPPDAIGDDNSPPDDGTTPDPDQGYSLVDITDPAQIKGYVTFDNGALQGDCQTKNDGADQLLLVAKDKIIFVKEVRVSVKDNTVWEQTSP